MNPRLGTTSAVIARAVPKTSYWFMGLWVYPIGSIVFTAVLVMPISNLLHYRPSPRLLWTCWIILTLCISAWAYVRDYRRLHYTLTSDALIWGRGNAGVVIPFSEIESIVIGLPDQLPWWIRLQRYFGRSGIYRAHAAYWKNVPVLKLSGSRYLPLAVGQARLFLRGFDALVAELLRLNSSKIVNSSSYDEMEVRALVAVRYNIINKIER